MTGLTGPYISCPHCGTHTHEVHATCVKCGKPVSCEPVLVSSRVCERGTKGCDVVHGFAGGDRCRRAPMSAETVIAACVEALGRAGGADVVYVHADGREPAVAAVVRPDTPEWNRLHDYYKERDDFLSNHDHIEPGMF